MAKKEKKQTTTDEELRARIEEAIDELGDAFKNVSIKVFSGFIDKSVELFSEMLDKQKISLKKKVRGVKNDSEEPD